MTRGVDLGSTAARRLAELECCEIAPGLTDAEFARIEAEHGVEFADDHRAFLAAGLPVNSPFEPEPGVFHTWEQPWPEWRGGDQTGLREQLDWPVRRVLEKVETGGHWNRAWGERPDAPEAAVEVARQALAEAPRLVPVYGHRFLPAGRGTSGHPVLSVWGTDIMCYGTDLADYVDREFRNPTPEFPDDWAPRATVPFWREYS
ncbi:hypothetical protein [Lentzea flaviverrucosa]|uniref:SMI1/KNR4 family protein n=1 Tax=Lentzea flaviverrucosa TaxID=200379 RepID=A0A1H9RXA6_9PSEU|nr:hypothetical protein [Lentzea flaviverrucosa]RDI33187.1 hypothetical protein DFR72_102436 [Lentzea flaviverrucosa]SER77391.1 hypothetical protein SAMN05216195_106438 [Lentzea flaviverrucosa]